MSVLNAYAPFSRSGTAKAHAGATPPRPALRGMLDDLDRQLRLAGLAPVSLVCRSWLEGEKAIAWITLAVESGEPSRTLSSWYEWQHPVWQWIKPPAALIVETVQ